MMIYFVYEIYTTAYAQAIWEIGYISDDVLDEVKKVIKHGACVKVFCPCWCYHQQLIVMLNFVGDNTNHGKNKFSPAYDSYRNVMLRYSTRIFI